MSNKTSRSTPEITETTEISIESEGKTNKTDWMVYLLQCADNSFYCGITNNLAKRLELHKRGKASRYTRARLPIKLVFVEEQHNHSSALKREYAIKQFKRAHKIRLVASSKLSSVYTDL